MKVRTDLLAGQVDVIQQQIENALDALNASTEDLSQLQEAIEAFQQLTPMNGGTEKQVDLSKFRP
jgi:hypothetical protein